MAQPTTSIRLNKTTPAAPTGKQNVVFQSDGATPQQGITAYDPDMVGDTGTGGAAGNAPAPAAGDAAQGKFLSAGGSFSTLPLAVSFGIGSGQVGTNVTNQIISPRYGLMTVCRVVVKASDPGVAFTFTIKQNGATVFTADNVVAAGTAAGTIAVFTNLVTTPLPVTQGDIFTMDIATGSTSWQVTAQLES